MRSIIRSILSGFGVRQIHEASDGADALEAVIDRTPDIVLCDWAMAPVSGAEFIKILRRDKDPHISTTPVVVISAHSRKTTIIEAMRIGIHGFVAKPVAPAVLYNRIGTVLDKQAVQGRSKGLFQQPGPRTSSKVDVMDLQRQPAPAPASRQDMLSLALL